MKYTYSGECKINNDENFPTRFSITWNRGYEWANIALVTLRNIRNVIVSLYTGQLDEVGAIENERLIVSEDGVNNPPIKTDCTFNVQGIQSFGEIGEMTCVLRDINTLELANKILEKLSDFGYPTNGELYEYSPYRITNLIVTYKDK